MITDAGVNMEGGGAHVGVYPSNHIGMSIHVRACVGVLMCVYA